MEILWIWDPKGENELTFPVLNCSWTWLDRQFAIGNDMDFSTWATTCERSMTSLLRTASVLSWKFPAVPSHYYEAYEIWQALCLRWFCYDLMYHNSVFPEMLYLLSNEEWHCFKHLPLAFIAKEMQFTYSTVWGIFTQYSTYWVNSTNTVFRGTDYRVSVHGIEAYNTTSSVLIFVKWSYNENSGFWGLFLIWFGSWWFWDSSASWRSLGLHSFLHLLACQCFVLYLTPFPHFLW